MLWPTNEFSNEVATLRNHQYCAEKSVNTLDLDRALVFDASSPDWRSDIDHRTRCGHAIVINAVRYPFPADVVRSWTRPCGNAGKPCCVTPRSSNRRTDADCASPHDRAWRWSAKPLLAHFAKAEARQIQAADLSIARLRNGAVVHPCIRCNAKTTRRFALTEWSMRSSAFSHQIYVLVSLVFRANSAD